MNLPARLAILLLAAWAATLPRDAAAATTKHVHSDAAGGDFIITCDAGPITADYTAKTESGIPLTDPYAVERGADKGLVRLMSEGGRRAMRYVVPHARIRAIVRVKADQTIPDWADLIFTRTGLTLVHTATANAGIFTDSDVYQLPYGQLPYGQLPYGPAGGIDKAGLKDAPDLLRMLDLGLQVYDPRKVACQP